MNTVRSYPFLPALDSIIQSDPLIVDADTPIAAVVDQLNRQGATAALIRANGQISGAVTIRDIVRLIRATPAVDGLRVGGAISQAVTSANLAEIESVLDALRLLAQSQAGNLVVYNPDGSLAGVISQESICAGLSPAMLVRMRTVAEVMARELISAAPDTSLLAIADMLEQHQISSVVIADAAAGGARPLGLITDRDITRAHAAGTDLASAPAYHHLAPQPISIGADATLWEAHAAMDRAHVRRLLVVDGQGRLIGLLTQSALLTASDPQEIRRTVDLIQRSMSPPAVEPRGSRPASSDLSAHSRLRLLLVDDNGLFLQVLQRLLLSRGFTVVGAVSSGREAIEQARLLRPDIILMDVEMPGISGLEAMGSILDERPDARIVMLTVAEDDETLFDAVRLGAAGYLLKDVDIDQLSKYIVGLMRGEAALSPVLAQRVLIALASQMRQDSAIQPDPSSMLTHHQIRILTLLAQGNTYKEIGRILGYSERAIKYHTGEAIRQLRLKDRAEAIAYARAHMQRGSWPQVGDP